LFSPLVGAWWGIGSFLTRIRACASDASADVRRLKQLRAMLPPRTTLVKRDKSLHKKTYGLIARRQTALRRIICDRTGKAPIADTFVPIRGELSKLSLTQPGRSISGWSLPQFDFRVASMLAWVGYGRPKSGTSVEITCIACGKTRRFRPLRSAGVQGSGEASAAKQPGLKSSQFGSCFDRHRG
jgi:hypothetical protein